MRFGGQLDGQRGSGCGGKRFVKQRHRFDAGRRAATVAHRQIGFARREIGGAVIGADVQLDIGAGSLKSGKARHQPAGGELGRERQHHAPTLGAADAFGGLGDGGKTAADGFGKHPPLDGQHHGAGAALEQRFAQLCFQRADAVADGGGAQRKFGSGGFETAQPRRSFKGMQRTEGKRNVVHRHRYSESK